MYPAPFEYHRAKSVGDAVGMLEQFGDDGKLIAGGHSLLPMMKLRFTQPTHLIDVRKLPELQGIRDQARAQRPAWWVSPRLSSRRRFNPAIRRCSHASFAVTPR